MLGSGLAAATVVAVEHEHRVARRSVSSCAAVSLVEQTRALDVGESRARPASGRRAVRGRLPGVEQLLQLGRRVICSTEDGCRSGLSMRKPGPSPVSTTSIESARRRGIAVNASMMERHAVRTRAAEFTRLLFGAEEEPVLEARIDATGAVRGLRNCCASISRKVVGRRLRSVGPSTVRLLTRPRAARCRASAASEPSPAISCTMSQPPTNSPPDVELRNRRPVRVVLDAVADRRDRASTSTVAYSAQHAGRGCRRPSRRSRTAVRRAGPS